MSNKKFIWVGPGVLRPSTPTFKGKKPLMPGEEIPVDFVRAGRIDQLSKVNKIVTSDAYAKSMAASGIKPVENAASKIKTLEAEKKELQKENEALRKEVEELQKEGKAVNKGEKK